MMSSKPPRGFEKFFKDKNKKAEVKEPEKKESQEASKPSKSADPEKKFEFKFHIESTPGAKKGKSSTGNFKSFLISF